MEAVGKSANVYDFTWRLAAALEVEWSDFIFGLPPRATVGQRDEGFDPLIGIVAPSFFIEIGQLVAKWSKACRGEPKRYCDVGGGVGRTVYEIDRHFPALTELVLLEPSKLFGEWAEWFLAAPQTLEWVPVVDRLLQPEYRQPAQRPDPIREAAQRLRVYALPVEETPRPRGYFDLLTCLNVVDRHPHPQALMRALWGLLAPEGLLVLCSPLHFDPVYTPDQGRWVSDLKELTGENAWMCVGETECRYDMRVFKRFWCRYSCQVLGLKKRADHGV
jgi:SAM-dependent methyltransferase